MAAKLQEVSQPTWSTIQFVVVILSLGNCEYVSKTMYQLRITLRGSKPPIWRRVAVPSDITLGQLHQVIQIAMGWTGSHLHQFVLRDKSLMPSGEEIREADKADSWSDAFANRIRGERVFVMTTTPFGEPTELEGEDENTVTLAQVCPKVKSKLTYEYDFDDGWEHLIEVQKITPEESEPGAKYPVCLDGKKACPPDDCGGIYGYYHMLEVLADPEHEDHIDLMEWLGGNFDSDAFDLNKVNGMLTQWRKSAEI